MDEVWTDVLGEMREGWDCEVREELGGCCEEGADSLGEAAEVRVCHFLSLIFLYVLLRIMYTVHKE